MNIFKTNQIILISLFCSSQYAYAGSISGNQVSLDLLQLSRDSGKSTTYLYDNGGTVNNAADDTPVGSTDTFNDTADLGYRLSGTIGLSNNWSINAGFSNNKMDVSSSFSDPSGRLEIFRNPVTSEFDSAHSVNSSYRSKISGEEINGIYNFNNSLDFTVGFGHINLNERFKITSDDTGSVGIGTYVIHTDNNMLGVNAGINYSAKSSNGFGVYFLGKLGWYDNKTKQSQQLNDPSITRTNDGSDSASSMLTEIRLGVNYSFTKEFIVNLGYQQMKVTNVALAESQFNTTALGSNAVAASDDIQWDGFNLGINYLF